VIENNKKPEKAGELHTDYAHGQVPTQWEAWLRNKRTEPPTQEEIDQRLAFTYKVQRRAIIKEMEDDARQEQAYRDGLIARERSEGMVEIAAREAIAPNPNTRTQPTPQTSSQTSQGSGSGYQPESWQPGEATTTTEERAQPESWTPGGGDPVEDRPALDAWKPTGGGGKHGGSGKKPWN